MRTQRVLIGLIVSVCCGMAAPHAGLSQEYRGTMGQQMACTSDVWRLCSSHVPDVSRIVACLRRNTPDLSKGCRAVFEQSSNAPRRGDDHGYNRERPYNRDYEQRPYRQYGPRPYEDEY